MKVKDLILKLKEFPEDIEVVMDTGPMFYNTEIDLDVITATVYPEDLNDPDPLMMVYHKKDSDDYWNFRRVDTDVLLIY